MYTCPSFAFSPSLSPLKARASHRTLVLSFQSSLLSRERERERQRQKQQRKGSGTSWEEQSCVAFFASLSKRIRNTHVCTYTDQVWLIRSGHRPASQPWLVCFLLKRRKQCFLFLSPFLPPSSLSLSLSTRMAIIICAMLCYALARSLPRSFVSKSRPYCPYGDCLSVSNWSRRNGVDARDQHQKAALLSSSFVFFRARHSHTYIDNVASSAPVAKQDEKSHTGCAAGLYCISIFHALSPSAAPWPFPPLARIGL